MLTRFVSDYPSSRRLLVRQRAAAARWPARAGLPEFVLRLTCVCLLLLNGAIARADEATQPAEPSSTPEPPITISGQILGITIGMPMRDARERLEPLRDKVASPFDEKEKMGLRTYWKLVGTEYDWVMAWANRDRKITKIHAVLRTDHLKPFDQIGELSKAISSNPEAAVWDVFRETASFRLTALGTEARAVRITMLALDPSLPVPVEPDEPQ